LAARLRQLNGEVELIRPFGVFLAGDRALEVFLQPRDHVLAGRVVGRDQERRLDAFLIEIFADRLGNLVALPRHRKEPGRAQLAGNLGRACISADQECLRIDRGLQRGQQDIRPDVAGEKTDAIGTDQLVGLLLADLGLLLIILVDDLGGDAADLAAEMVERELEAVAHIVADHRGGPAERGDETDLGALLCRNRRDRQRQQSREARGFLFRVVLPRFSDFL
jgi:hypothetical protein